MAYLEIIEGYNHGLVLYLSGETSIGRSPENMLCLPESRASREHAILRVDEHGAAIIDLGSANGTYVNGERLKGKKSCPLHDSDIIKISNTHMRFHADSTDGKKPDSTLMAAVITGDTEDSHAIGVTLDAQQSVVAVEKEAEQSPEKLLQVIARLQAMVQVTNALGAVTGQAPILERIMQSIFDIFPRADRAFIMLVNPASGELEPFMGRHREKSAVRHDLFTISRTITRAVAQKRQSILSSDAQSDQRFQATDSVAGFSIRSVMCVPLICHDQVLGVISVDTISSPQAFNADDLAMLTGIAAQAGVALKNAELYETIQAETEKRALLSRYMSPDIVQGVMEGSIPIELGGREAHGTVVFCDILGFTPMSEAMSAVEIVDRLNRYYRLTTEVVTHNKGTLHKFGGDMIMAFWNVMFEDADHAFNAVLTGLKMQIAVWAFDLGLLQEGQPPIYLGIGCNTGSFAAGNVGGEGCMEYTVIGDNVNIAQRVESLAGRWQTLTSQTTYRPVAERALAVELPPVQLKGRSMPVRVFSIRGLLLNEKEAILTVPAGIIGPGGSHVGLGMISGAHFGKKKLTLTLSTGATLEKGAAIVLEFKLTEFSQAYKIGARVKEIDRGEHEGHAVYSEIELTDIRGDEAVMDFLRPGSAPMSPRSWEEMKRQ